jgi:hypothetical protein
MNADQAYLIRTSLIILQEIEQAKAAGYECSMMDVDPSQPEESIRRLKENLQSRHYDLFVIGFGLRSNAVC